MTSDLIAPGSLCRALVFLLRLHSEILFLPLAVDSRLSVRYIPKSGRFGRLGGISDQRGCFFRLCHRFPVGLISKSWMRSPGSVTNPAERNLHGTNWSGHGDCRAGKMRPWSQKKIAEKERKREGSYFGNKKGRSNLQSALSNKSLAWCGGADTNGAPQIPSACPDFLLRVAASINCVWFSLRRTT